MEPSAVILFVVFWIVSAMIRSAGQKGRKGARRQGPARPRQASEWPQMPEGPVRPVAELPPFEPDAFPPAVAREPAASAPVDGARLDAARPGALQAGGGRLAEDVAPVAEAAPGVADMLDPGTMLAGIVLSEVLGPPKGRRPRGFSRIPLRNRL